MKKFFTALVVTYATSSLAQAACEITVTRTPCPGKKIRAEALGPYGDKEVFPVAAKKVAGLDEAGCKAETITQGTIQRKGLFLKKVAEGKFDGKVVETKTDIAEASTCKPEPQ